MAVAESEPLGRARWRSSAEARAESEPWGRARRSFVVFRVLARVRALGSGGAEFVVFRDLARVRALGRAERSSPSSGAEPESEPWVGRSFLWCLWQGLTACQSHSVKWHCSRSYAGGAVLLSGRSVERAK